MLNTGPEKINLELSVIVSKKNGNACIELRRNVSDVEIVRKVLSCAYHNKPIIVLPVFRNRLQSIQSMLDKGIIFKDGNQYKFNF